MVHFVEVVHLGMPTRRARHQVTETDDIMRALDRAAQEWPGESRSRLLLRLVQIGVQALEVSAVERELRFQTALHRLTTEFGDVYRGATVDEFRSDWPA